MSWPGSSSRRGIGADQRFELADQLGVATQGQIGLDATPEDRDPQFLEADDIASPDGIELDPVEHWATPEGQGLGQPVRHGGGSVVKLRLSGQFLETLEVELTRDVRRR